MNTMNHRAIDTRSNGGNAAEEVEVHLIDDAPDLHRYRCAPMEQ